MSIIELPKKIVRKIQKFKTGDNVPDGAVYLDTKSEPIPSDSVPGKFNYAYHHFFIITTEE